MSGNPNGNGKVTAKSARNGRPRVEPTWHDRQLLGRARQGDADAFMELIRPYDREHRALAYQILGDRHRMDDALQEAFLKAYRGLSGFNGRAALGTWLYRIVYNACLDELRREGRVIHLPLEQAEHVASSSDPGSVASARTGLLAALRSLPADLRTVVLLVHADGLDYEATSEVLGIPVGTVASRLHRARAALRAEFDGGFQGQGTRASSVDARAATFPAPAQRSRRFASGTCRRGLAAKSASVTSPSIRAAACSSP